MIEVVTDYEMSCIFSDSLQIFLDIWLFINLMTNNRLIRIEDSKFLLLFVYRIISHYLSSFQVTNYIYVYIIIPTPLMSLYAY